MFFMLGAALAAFIAVASLMMSLFRGRRSTSREAERRLGSISRASLGEVGVEGVGLLTRRSSPLPLMRRFIAKNDVWADKVAIDLQQAGLHLKVSEYLLLRMFVGGIAAFLVLFLFRGSPIGFIVAIPAGFIGFMVPALWINMRKSRRQAKITSQLVEALQLISNALRSGFAFTQAVELAARQMARPIQDELHYFLRDNSLGARPEDALRAMVVRSGSLDLDMLVTTILVQRTTGGNLSEVLDNVAETLRERERLRAEIKALTATQRLTGQILSVYPIILGLVLFALAPDLMKVLVTTEVGRLLLGIALGLQVIGALTIRRILTLDV